MEQNSREYQLIRRKYYFGSVSEVSVHGFLALLLWVYGLWWSRASQWEAHGAEKNIIASRRQRERQKWMEKKKERDWLQEKEIGVVEDRVPLSPSRSCLQWPNILHIEFHNLAIMPQADNQTLKTRPLKDI
jgi:hypothetical protein